MLKVLILSAGLMTSSFTAANANDCSDAVIAPSDARVPVPILTVVDCFENETVDVSVNFEVISDATENAKIAYAPHYAPMAGIQLVTPNADWCSEVGGHITMDFKVDCGTAGEEYKVFFTSGALTSQENIIRIFRP